MKKTIFQILVIFLLGCKNDKLSGESCNPGNPFEMQWFSEWIADLQNCACTVSVFQADLEGEPVFWELMTDPLCQGVISEITIYNCEGSEYIVLNSFDELAGFQKKVKNLKIVYQCPTIRNGR